MRETLYIRLDADGAGSGADVEYGVAAASDLRVQTSERGSLEQALALAPGRRLILFAPTADVRLTTATVPAKQAAKVLQAVPFALEDQVAEDVDLLHFAIGPRQVDDSHPVAVVSRRRMDAWLGPIQSRGLRIDALVPETLALPVDPDPLHWHALADGSQVTVRNGAWSGFTCEIEELLTFLTLADADKTHRLRLRVTADSATDWTLLDWPLELFPGVPGSLAALAATYRPETAINLLQGSYALGRDLNKVWQPWRLAAGMAVAWIAVAAIAFGIDTWRLNAELDRQNEANLARFQSLFPNETKVVDMGAQLDQQVRALAGASGGGGVFPLLEALTPALAATGDLKLTGLQYRDGVLFLSLTGPDLQSLESLRNWFAQNRGAALEVQSANAESGTAQIRAKLSPA
ncbi:MAG: type II secretion system protein GspL [Panacagrimonas sp.]